MQKKYIVRLSDEERDTLEEVAKKLKGTSQKVRRAQILLKADVNGPNWTDKQIADAFSCRTKTVENVRQRLVERGFDETLNGKKRATRQRRNFWVASKRPRSSPCDLGRRRKATRTGPCGSWHEKSWSWRLSTRSVTKPFGARLKKRYDQPQD